MQRINTILALLVLLLSWSFVTTRPPGNPIMASGSMNVGSSVPGMNCPDPALNWPCSVSPPSSRHAPPPAGCMVSLSKDNNGKLRIYILKTDLAPEFKTNWIQADKFYTPQIIEVERGLSNTVMGIDAALYIQPGYYPITETAEAYLIQF